MMTSESTQKALREYLKSTQRAIREKESNQTSSYHWSLKYSVLSLIDKINFVSGLSANKWVRFDDDVLTSNNLVAPFNLCHFSNLFVDHNYKIIFSFHII